MDAAFPIIIIALRFSHDHFEKIIISWILLELSEEGFITGGVWLLHHVHHLLVF